MPSPPRVPNVVFVGCPWRVVRPKYVRCARRLEKRFPLSVALIDSSQTPNAQQLFTLIKEQLARASLALFDVTGGNSNVSLEFGLAEGYGVPRRLLLSTHRLSRRSGDAPIIADLAGATRLNYARESGLLRHLTQLFEQHPYTSRFERFLSTRYRRRSGPEKKRLRTLALKAVHLARRDPDGQPPLRRDIVDRLRDDATGYSEGEVSSVLGDLHAAGLVRVGRRRYSRVEIT